METIILIKYFKLSERFKSYYVVWKLANDKDNYSLSEKFKSYYVVWKQNLLAGEKIILFEFKSYYVVWKPYGKWEIGRDSMCLNRTMQYGNSEGMQQAEATQKKFKSYYVVWKRNPKENIIPVRYSLNRTMQYGNTPVGIY